MGKTEIYCLGGGGVFQINEHIVMRWMCMWIKISSKKWCQKKKVHAQADPFNFISGVIFGSNVIYFEYRSSLSWFRILLVNSSKKCGWIFPYLAYDVPVYNTCCILAVVNKIRIIYSWWIKNYKFKYISIVGQHEYIKF